MKNTKGKERFIENFELEASYYEDSWINGNKSHVAEELSELFECSELAAMRILCDLPRHISKYVLNSQAMFDTIIKMSMARKTQFRTR